ncbi:MAG: oxidoreductase [Gammaproteobacteria bacterium]|nr:oxidoreductase [Gammaproteobacteria bacterium]HJL96186.1 flavin reductase family protein [SAR86 cluster bacterium]|tara:strand:- start:3015 stop:3494 length:480 start_codon:yes stop_codon:yes gene_type:complete
MDNSKVQEDFLIAMRGITSTVYVISAKLDGERHAMTATSVASLSLTPPAMFVCINKEASLHGIIKKKQDFCINVLSNKQQELSEVCSNSDEGESRFRDDGWRDEGTLIYNINSLSNIFCSCTAIIDYSTHSVFLGEVVNVKNNSQEKALLYASGGYIID